MKLEKRIFERIKNWIFEEKGILEGIIFYFWFFFEEKEDFERTLFFLKKKNRQVAKIGHNKTQRNFWTPVSCNKVCHVIYYIIFAPRYKPENMCTTGRSSTNWTNQGEPAHRSWDNSQVSPTCITSVICLALLSNNHPPIENPTKP